jgi:hypothetical protein
VEGIVSNAVNVGIIDGPSMASTAGLTSGLFALHLLVDLLIHALTWCLVHTNRCLRA